MIRKTRPEVVRLLFQSDIGKTRSEFAVKRVISTLQKELHDERVEKVLVDLLNDGMLKADGYNLYKKASKNFVDLDLAHITALRLPKPGEVQVKPHDFYCFECHQPGTLVKCPSCWRAFHSKCYRAIAEIPNWFPTQNRNRAKDNVALYIRGRISTFDSIRAPMTQNNGNGSGNGNRSASTVGVVENHTNDYKLDVECLGEVRPPMRQRPNTTIRNVSYKTEMPTDEHENKDLNLCTCCRLMNKAKIGNPPNISTDELCYLMHFIYDDIHTWIQKDGRAALLDMPIPAELKEVLAKFLFSQKNHITMSRIAQKLDRREYTYINEFVIDILDVHHEMGVFFGSQDKRYEYSKLMLSDLYNLTTECRQCSDCFRHCNEQQSKYWFAKPCLQRHELVFAKIKSKNPYWPAKILRALGNNKFEVRFFGQPHQRASVPANYIKPIDTDLKDLKIGHGTKIKEALEELRWHNVLSSQSHSMFKFKAVPHIGDETIALALDGQLPGPIGEPIAIYSPANPRIMPRVSPTSTTPKRRGRPRLQRPVAVGTLLMTKVANTTTPAPTKRRGRPRKLVETVAAASFVGDRIATVNTFVKNEIRNTSTPATQKRRGRPKIVRATTVAAADQSVNAIQMDEAPPTLMRPPQKRRGRPRTVLAGDDAPPSRKLHTSIPAVRKYPLRNLGPKAKIAAKPVANNVVTKTYKQTQYKGLEHMVAELKRGRWCQLCLKEASIMCCFNAFYCSKKCQLEDLKQGHEAICQTKSKSKKR